MTSQVSIMHPNHAPSIMPIHFHILGKPINFLACTWSEKSGEPRRKSGRHVNLQIDANPRTLVLFFCVPLELISTSCKIKSQLTSVQFNDILVVKH